jgi:hypothetical protein
MTRLGAWEPTTTAEQLDRLTSLAEIEQLPRRYARALDARDLDALVELFVPDVRVGRERSGRAALRAWFVETLRPLRTTIHFVGNHVVDFDDADHARGVVYCRDEVELPGRGTWEVGNLQYWDTYERVHGDWCFARRRVHRWYQCDATERPHHGAGVPTGDALATGQLPESYASWGEFWREVDVTGS